MLYVPWKDDNWPEKLGKIKRLTSAVHEIKCGAESRWFWSKYVSLCDLPTLTRTNVRGRTS